jgi:uncharacterized membrane protein
LASFVGIFVWWALSVLLAVLAWPLTYRLFKFLPDRGLGLSRLVGWLFSGYLAWLLGFAFNHAATTLVSFAVLGVLAYKLYEPRKAEHQAFLSANGNLVFVYEMAFFFLLLTWSLVRMKHPNIEGQEKFMDFAFFNSILRDTQLPPADPWLAGEGHHINYYYFGYFLNANFARLTQLSPDYTYNLAVSNNFALCGVAMLSLGYNLTRKLWAGVAGLLALQVFGNLHGALQVLKVQWTGAFNWWEPTRLIKDVHAGGKYLNDWWWSASPAVLQKAGLGADAARDGLISEFPVFSFLHGDLHPHFSALPLTLLLLALGLNLLKSPDPQPLGLSRRWDSRWQGFTALALALGAIFMANTWDLPSAGLMASLLLLAQQHSLGQLEGRRLVQQWLLPSALLLLGLLLAALPFILFFNNPADKGFGLHGARTGLRDSLVFWGLFLAVLLPYSVLRLMSLAQGEAAPPSPAAPRGAAPRSGQAPRPAKPTACPDCGAKLRPGKAICGQCGARITAPELEPEAAMAEAAVLPPPAWVAAWLSLFKRPAQAFGHASVRFGAPVLAVAWLAALVLAPTTALFSALALLSALILAARGASREGQFAAAAALVASLFIILTEYVYLRDVFEGNPSLTRMNTVFKFYFQAWVLLAVALPFALHFAFKALLSRAFALRVSYGVLLGALALGALAYPVKAIAFVWEDWDRWQRIGQPTLDGAAWFKRDYPADYALVQRMRSEIPGQPVIAEACGGAYTRFARVSSYTGFRAVLGWANHQSQWRKQWPSQTEADCGELYQTQDLPRARALLDQYQVEYVFVGQLEREKHGASGGLDKFAQLGAPVMSEGSSVLYRVHR